MKIDNIKVNGFGKLEDREIKLSDNINLIYGKNESGKTTLLKFIPGMFFGVSKNKNGKDISDYDKYLPWGTDEFSGSLTYTLDSNEEFEIFREFKKKNPIIYNGRKEDITKEFSVSKTKGSEFFFEQTGIDETLWENTSLIQQGGSLLDAKSQDVLTEKISNLLTTGDDNTSYKESINKLNKKLLDEVGTDRTSRKTT